MPEARTKAASHPIKGSLDQKVINQALASITPTARLMFVVRCGLRIRGLMTHQLVGQGIDHMLSLGRRACLNPDLIDERFIKAAEFLQRCVESPGIPGIEDPQNKSTTEYKVEAVSVARVCDEIRDWHGQDESKVSAKARLAPKEAEDAVTLSRNPEEERALWQRAHYRALMSDLEHAKAGEALKSYEPFPSGPWGPLWLDAVPEWFELAERTRPLTSISDWHNDFLIDSSHLKPTWRTLKKILNQMTKADELRLPPRPEQTTDASLSKEIAEFKASVERVVELINADPSLAEYLLPSLSVLATKIEDSGHMLRTKEVSEMLGISQTRVGQLSKKGKITSSVVLGTSAFCRTEIEKVAKIERRAGRPSAK